MCVSDSDDGLQGPEQSIHDNSVLIHVIWNTVQFK